MLDDFFSRALIAGVGVALVAGPLGCYIVWPTKGKVGIYMGHLSPPSTYPHHYIPTLFEPMTPR